MSDSRIADISVIEGLQARANAAMGYKQKPMSSMSVFNDIILLIAPTTQLLNSMFISHGGQSSHRYCPFIVASLAAYHAADAFALYPIRSK